MYLVGICGHFGKNANFFDGQTVKTKTLTEELMKKLKPNNVLTLDTYGWKRNPILLLIKSCILAFKCKNIVILPAHNGVKVFSTIFTLLNKILKRKLHYVVIGGWLPNLLRENHKLKKRLHDFTGIYVETNVMFEELRKLGLWNIRLLPNFKRLSILDEKELVFSYNKPYKLCTFSRVMAEKGIEDAIDAVIAINKNFGKEIFTLDIYGQIDESYKERFEKMQKSFPGYISYKGCVDFNESVKVLKDYFALIFPTHFKTEGIPGTIIDAYSAGLPVLASQWDAASEIINHGITGFIYDFAQKSKLKELLLIISENPNMILNNKINCLRKAKKYSSETVVEEFIKYLM